MPGGRVGNALKVVMPVFVDNEVVGGGKRIQYLRPESTAFQALNYNVICDSCQ